MLSLPYSSAQRPPPPFPPVPSFAYCPDKRARRVAQMALEWRGLSSFPAARFPLRTSQRILLLVLYPVKRNGRLAWRKSPVCPPPRRESRRATGNEPPLRGVPSPSPPSRGTGHSPKNPELHFMRIPCNSKNLANPLFLVNHRPKREKLCCSAFSRRFGGREGLT